jgi:DNA-binding MarR family transcriptional regulator
VWIGYPLPGVGRLWDDAPQRPAADRLAVVLGSLRATILRSAGRPLTMSELAAVLCCSPANATHHCRPLVEAGLLERRRHGKNVLIIRTETGDAFTDLLG